MIRSLAAAAVVGALLYPAAPASAADVRPCVSKGEFNGLHGPQSRAQLEDRWEVAATVLDRGEYRIWVNYPACGYGPDEAGVQVGYSRATGLWVVAGHWRVQGATLSGTP